MGKSFHIRLAMPEDITAIAEVYADSIRQLCSKDYSAEIIAHWASSTPAESRLKAINKRELWVAEVEGVIGGYLVSIPGELVALFIHSSCVGFGMGKALATLGIQVAQQNYPHKVVLESTITAAPFYKKLGFEEVSVGYFSHGTSDLKIPVVNMILA